MQHPIPPHTQHEIGYLFVYCFLDCKHTAVLQKLDNFIELVQVRIFGAFERIGLRLGLLLKMKWKVHFTITRSHNISPGVTWLLKIVSERVALISSINGLKPGTRWECFWPCSACCKTCNLQYNLFHMQLYSRRFSWLVNWHQIPSELELFVLIFLTMAPLTRSLDGEPAGCWGVLAFAAFERAVVMLNIHSGFQTVTMPQNDYTSWSWSSPDLTISPSSRFCVRFEF